MEITTLSLAELRDAVENPSFFSGPVLPITRHRAMSQVLNPRAEDQDPVLLIARQDDAVRAFLGVLPDVCRSSGSERRFGWISGWWVEPTAARTGVGALLLMKALSLWQGNLAVGGFTDSARRVYEGCGRFQPVIEQPGVTVYLRLEGDMLRRRVSGSRFLGPLPDLVAGTLNAGQRLRLHRWRRNHALADDRRLEWVTAIDRQTADFLEHRGSDQALWRGPPEIAWMMRHPWVVSGSPSAKGGPHYPFSSVAASVDVTGLRVLDSNGEITAFLVVMVRDGELKLPILVCADEEIPRLAGIIVRHMINVGASRLATYNPALQEHIGRGSWPTLTTREAGRLFVFAKKLEDVDFSGSVFQDGEADCAFT